MIVAKGWELQQKGSTIALSFDESTKRHEPLIEGKNMKGRIFWRGSVFCHDFKFLLNVLWRQWYHFTKFLIQKEHGQWAKQFKIHKVQAWHARSLSLDQLAMSPRRCLPRDPRKRLFAIAHIHQGQGGDGLCSRGTLASLCLMRFRARLRPLFLTQTNQDIQPDTPRNTPCAYLRARAAHNFLIIRL